MTRIVPALAVVFVLTRPGLVLGHEVRPGYLEIVQTGEETFDVFFKVPARGEMRLSLYARMPEPCRVRAPLRTRTAVGAFIEQWSVACIGGLVGETIHIDGLSATLTDVLVRLERADGTAQIARLTPGNPAFVVEAVPSAWRVARTYLALGVEHILLGIDHLLFVLTLLLLVEGWRRLVATITAFTVAHSITLALASLGLLHVPQRPVEAVIALSIVFVAAEIVRYREGRPSLARGRPWIVAFSFGLLHGLGFAGALREVGLPEQSIPLALFFFNVGVEIGQLLFVAVAVTVIALLTRLEIRWPVWAWRVPTYGAGSLAAFWTIQRVWSFWQT